MKINLENNFLNIKLNPLEVILSHRGSLRIPLDHVVKASTKNPGWNLGQLRAPGTHVPFLLKAGTYRGANSKDFWHTTVGGSYLVIELKNWDYQRIVLTIGNNKVWAEQINQAAGAAKSD